MSLFYVYLVQQGRINQKNIYYINQYKLIYSILFRSQIVHLSPERFSWRTRLLRFWPDRTRRHDFASNFFVLCIFIPVHLCCSREHSYQIKPHPLGKSFFVRSMCNKSKESQVCFHLVFGQPFGICPLFFCIVVLYYCPDSRNNHNRQWTEFADLSWKLRADLWGEIRRLLLSRTFTVVIAMDSLQWSRYLGIDNRVQRFGSLLFAQVYPKRWKSHENYKEFAVTESIQAEDQVATNHYQCTA